VSGSYEKVAGRKVAAGLPRHISRGFTPPYLRGWRIRPDSFCGDVCAPRATQAPAPFSRTLSITSNETHFGELNLQLESGQSPGSFGQSPPARVVSVAPQVIGTGRVVTRALSLGERVSRGRRFHQPARDG